LNNDDKLSNDFTSGDKMELDSPAPKKTQSRMVNEDQTYKNRIDNNTNNNNTTKMSDPFKTSAPKSFTTNTNTNNNNNQDNNINGPMAMDTSNDDEETNESKPPSANYATELPPEAFGEEQQQTERVPCPQCNRKFAQEALQKHIKICKKVFCQKRKAFDVAAQRVEEDAAKASTSCEAEDKQAAAEAALKAKKEKWKNESLFLREAIKAAREVSQAIAEGKDISKIPVAKK